MAIDQRLLEIIAERRHGVLATIGQTVAQSDRTILYVWDPDSWLDQAEAPSRVRGSPARIHSAVRLR
jgi:hypothetical protein